MFHKLLLGHENFKREYFQEEAALFSSLASGVHEPYALMISCCDARVVPDIILNSDPGDLFVLRNIAALVPPYQTNPGRSVGAAIEYAIHGLKVKHVIVCGHTSCGGLKALADGPMKLAAHMPSLAEWLADADAVYRKVKEVLASAEDQDILQQLAYESVPIQLEHLMTYPAVQWALEREKLQLHGWVYNLASGSLDVYKPEQNEFVPLKSDRRFNNFDGDDDESGG